MHPRALAIQLGQAIKETPEYLSVQAAKAKIGDHEAAGIMVDDLKRRQEAYQKALGEGRDGKEEAGELRKLGEIAGYNPYIRELFTAETRLAELVVGLQREMMAAAGLIEFEEGGVCESDGQDG